MLEDNALDEWIKDIQILVQALGADGARLMRHELFARSDLWGDPRGVCF